MRRGSYRIPASARRMWLTASASSMLWQRIMNPHQTLCSLPAMSPLPVLCCATRYCAALPRALLPPRPCSHLAGGRATTTLSHPNCSQGGQLGLGRFMAAFFGVALGDSRNPMLEQLFAAMDEDGDGCISCEARAALDPDVSLCMYWYSPESGRAPIYIFVVAQTPAGNISAPGACRPVIFAPAACRPVISVHSAPHATHPEAP